MPTTDSKIHLITTTTTESPMPNVVDKGHLFATTPPPRQVPVPGDQPWVGGTHNAPGFTASTAPARSSPTGRRDLQPLLVSASCRDPRSDRADSLDRRPRPMAHFVSSTMTTPEPSLPPQTWTSERAEGFVCLGQTEHAPSSEFRDLWMGTIDPTD
jgi:hypothetical protein